MVVMEGMENADLRVNVVVRDLRVNADAKDLKENVVAMVKMASVV
jgi:hypothetical protein